MQLEHYKCVVLLPHLRIQSANAISSPLTWGFPAPSAFAGFAHALERRLQRSGRSIRLPGVGIVCHRVEPQVAEGFAFAPRGFRLTRNPVDQHGDTSAIVEEGRAHLTVSLLLTVQGDDAPTNVEAAEQLAKELLDAAMGMRIAGGSVFAGTVPRHVRRRAWVSDNFAELDPQVPRIKRQLLPGFALLSRDELFADHLAKCRASNANATALDALLDFSRLRFDPSAKAEASDSHDVQWPPPRREYSGWLVPISVGYAAISELYPPGSVKAARDQNTPFRFVESLLSLGEWRSPHRIQALDDLFWRHQAEPVNGLYRLVNR